MPRLNSHVFLTELRCDLEYMHQLYLYLQLQKPSKIDWQLTIRILQDADWNPKPEGISPLH